MPSLSSSFVINLWSTHATFRRRRSTSCGGTLALATPMLPRAFMVDVAPCALEGPLGPCALSLHSLTSGGRAADLGQAWS
eukprot:2194440-Pyramimonas_sp.AAC.1